MSAKTYILLEPLCVILLCLPALQLWSGVQDATRTQLAHSALFALAALASAYYLVSALGSRFIARSLKGKDMGRRGTKDEHVEMCVAPQGGAAAFPCNAPPPARASHATPPPTLLAPLPSRPPSPSGVGLVCAVVFLICVIMAQWWHRWRGGEAPMEPFYHSALLSICFMTLLGFADDVLDLPWRYKFILPVFASLPLLATYNGKTDIVLPALLGQWLLQPGTATPTPLGRLLEVAALSLQPLEPSGAVLMQMGQWYYVYMGCLGVFATNAINIYAGINGLEAGQAVVITIAVLTTNLLEIATSPKEPHMTAHLFSALLGLPFLAVTLAALAHNLYPARVFVGDTFCYFAGMTLAVQGIHGHFAKTLLIFFAPQVFNFFYSVPQLAKVYPCPRHRLPHFNAATGLMEPSQFEVPSGRSSLCGGGSSGSAAAAAAAAAAEAVAPPASLKARRGSLSGAPRPAAGAGSSAAPRRMMDNWTLINLVLRLTGPLHERTLTNVLLLLQVASCLVGLALRMWHSSSVCSGATPWWGGYGSCE